MPRFYLKRFGLANRIAFATRDGHGHPSVSVADVAVRRHFYSFNRPDGSLDPAVEKYFDQQVEVPAAPALEAFSNGTNDSGDRDLVVKFLAFQIARSPRFRAVDQALAASLAPMLAGVAAADAYRQANRNRPFDERELREVFDQARYRASAQSVAVPDANSSIRIMLRKADELGELLRELRFAVAVCETPILLTSDTPVVVFRPNANPDGFYGFTPDSSSELRFPLDPTHLLVGSPVSSSLGPDRFSAPTELVLQANEQQRRECHNSIFYTPGTLPGGGTVLGPLPPALPEPTISLAPGDGTTSKPEFRTPNDPEIASLIESTHPPEV